jgi:hypothetical protein
VQQKGATSGRHGCIGVSGKPTLGETLRTTSAMLKAIRKMVGETGHLYDMVEIDTLINAAQVEADRRAAIVEIAAKWR